MPKIVLAGIEPLIRVIGEKRTELRHPPVVDLLQHHEIGLGLAQESHDPRRIAGIRIDVGQHHAQRLSCCHGRGWPAEVQRHKNGQVQQRQRAENGCVAFPAFQQGDQGNDGQRQEVLHTEVGK